MSTRRTRHHALFSDHPPTVTIFGARLPAMVLNGRQLIDDQVVRVSDPRILQKEAPYPDPDELPSLARRPGFAAPQ